DRAQGVRRVLASAFEVDPHDDAAHTRVADLLEARVGERLDGAHVQFPPGDLLTRLGAHRVALHGARAALARVADRRGGQRVADAAPAVAAADHEAGHRPDPVVLLVLVPAAPDRRLAEQPG